MHHSAPHRRAGELRNPFLTRAAGIADADALRAVPVEKKLSTETIEMTTDVFVVGGVMGDDSPSGANNGWALTAGKLAAEAIAE